MAHGLQCCRYVGTVEAPREGDVRQPAHVLHVRHAAAQVEHCAHQRVGHVDQAYERHPGTAEQRDAGGSHLHREQRSDQLDGPLLVLRAQRRAATTVTCGLLVTPRWSSCEGSPASRSACQSRRTTSQPASSGSSSSACIRGMPRSLGVEDDLVQADFFATLRPRVTRTDSCDEASKTRTQSTCAVSETSSAVSSWSS